jgi:hypothetical protein
VLENPTVNRLEPRASAHRILALTARETFPILVVASTAVLLARHLAAELAQDSWLAFLSGRIVWHGLPHHDHLIGWANGVSWVDQQWLGQLFIYGLYAAGGVKLALLTNAALVLATVVGGIAIARSGGAAPIRTAIVAGVCIPVVAITWQLRTQTLAAVFLTTLLWLLVTDGRRPSNRVLFALPLLVLWANVHGTVLVGAFLVIARGAFQVWSDRRLTARTAALLAGPVVCVFLSPYGLSLAGYYRKFLFNRGFSNYIVEWAPTKLTQSSIPFYVLLLGAFWLLGRSKTLTGFERLAVAVTAVLGIGAVRNTLWFALTAVVILPRALEEAWPENAPQRRLNVFMGLAATGIAAVSVALAIARPVDGLDKHWPPKAATAVAVAARKDPSLRIYANLRWADWLLFTHPELAGRVEFDARVELLKLSQLAKVFQFANRVGDWQTVVAGDRLLVLDLTQDRAAEKVFLARRGTRRLYRDDGLSVLLRPRT